MLRNYKELPGGTLLRDSPGATPPKDYSLKISLYPYIPKGIDHKHLTLTLIKRLRINIKIRTL